MNKFKQYPHIHKPKLSLRIHKPSNLLVLKNDRIYVEKNDKIM
jgi:ABC-type uncharacterized transport system auxiliary subunit